MSLLADEYLKWNRAIAATYFSREKVGQPVYLDLDENSLRDIGETLGFAEDARDQFLEAIRSSLTLTSPNIFHRHIASCESWAQKQNSRVLHRELNEPPCVALLGFFAHVAEVMTSDEQFNMNNYYGRLNDLLSLSERDKDRVDRNFRKHTPRFWSLLNTWLEDRSGAFGYPTAFVFDRRRFVGLPISQALVRSTDREKLKDFFVECGLQPGQRASNEELIALLREWVPSSALSASFKSVWEQRAAKERVAEVAALELESWDGLINDVNQTCGRQINLLLGAQLRKRPRLAVSFELLVRDSNLALAGQYNIEGGSPVFRGGASILLSQASSDQWLSIDDEYSVPAALSANIELSKGSAPPVNLSRKSKRISILRFVPEDGIYIETRHIGLLEKSLLLVQSSLSNSVKEYLDEVARPGFLIYTSEDIQGLPEDWVLFRDVQVTGVIPTDLHDLAPLQVAGSSEISFDGGFPIPGRSTWHTKRPPQVSAVNLSQGGFKLGVVRESNFFEEEHQELIHEQEAENSCVVDLKEIGLTDGDYRIVLTPPKSKGQPRTRLLRLRSGDTPRPRLRQHVHHTNEPNWPLTTKEELDEKSFFGASILGLPDNRIYRSQMPQLEISFSGEPESHTIARETGSVTYRAECLELGYHHWILPPEDESNRKRQLKGFCKHCGLEEWHGRRVTKFTKESRKLSARMAKAILPAPEPLEAMDIELGLDALTYAHDGSWASFVSIVESIDDSPLFSYEFSNTLQGFGYIELNFDQRTHRPRSWSICAPTIATKKEGDAIFVGGRSDKLLARLNEDVTAIGGETHLHPDSRIPLVRITGLSEEDLEDVCRSLSSFLGVDVHFANRPGEQLAIGLPHLRELVDCLPTLKVGRQTLARFNLNTGRWEARSEFDASGAYRVGERTRLYGVAGVEALSKGELKIADHRTVKHIAAIDAGKSLCAFDPDVSTLVVPLGSELPALYERAVLLSSFEPPNIQGGAVLYENVDEDVAKQICWKLAGENN